MRDDDDEGFLMTGREASTSTAEGVIVGSKERDQHAVLPLSEVFGPT